MESNRIDRQERLVQQSDSALYLLKLLGSVLTFQVIILIDDALRQEVQESVTRRPYLLRLVVEIEEVAVVVSVE